MKYDNQPNNPRTSFVHGQLGVKGKQLVPRDKILFAPLHIKLGLFSQFIFSLKLGGRGMKYLKSKYRKISDPRLESGTLDGSKIRKLMKDQEFKSKLTVVERAAWCAFIDLCEQFLGNFKSPNYERIVKKCVDAFEKQGIKETVKLHFIRAHLDYFPANCGRMSDEQGERFHQELSRIEKRYQGRWDKRMLADYVWSLKRESNYTYSYID